MPLAVHMRVAMPQWIMTRTDAAPLMDAVFRPRLQRLMLRWERGAKLLTPVDTGLLRSSITGRLEGGFGLASGGLRGALGSNVVYAEYVELGTRGRPGVRMLQASLTQLEGALDDEMQAGLREFRRRLVAS